MKRNTIKELHTKSKQELVALKSELQSDIKKLVIELGARRLKNVSLIGSKKKDLARVLTILREKELTA